MCSFMCCVQFILHIYFILRRILYIFTIFYCLPLFVSRSLCLSIFLTLSAFLYLPLCIFLSVAMCHKANICLVFFWCLRSCHVYLIFLFFFDKVKEWSGCKMWMLHPRELFKSIVNIHIAYHFLTLYTHTYNIHTCISMTASAAPAKARTLSNPQSCWKGIIFWGFL
jgi:hypothetical protein